MIQVIGMMIGGYIFTKMLELLGKQDTTLIAKVFAVLTMLFVAFGQLALLSTGFKLSNL
jgi:glucose uptake protein GlcU